MKNEKPLESGTGILFKKAALAMFAVIASAGKYSLQVFSNVTDANLVESENGNKKYIVTLKAIAADKLHQLKEVFQDAEEVEIEKTNGLFMTCNIWVKEGQPTHLPIKGEKIECIVDEVPSRETPEELVLRVTGARVPQAATAPKLDIVNFFADAEKSEASKGELVHK